METKIRNLESQEGYSKDNIKDLIKYECFEVKEEILDDVCAHNRTVVKQEPSDNTYEVFCENESSKFVKFEYSEVKEEILDNISCIDTVVKEESLNTDDVCSEDDALESKNKVLITIETVAKVKKTFYKYCTVPKCKNTVRSTPDKIFFPVPKDMEIRKIWCEIMSKSRVLSPLSTLHCCEDHFNIKEDTTNYMKYNIMKQHGMKVSLRLKRDAVPHIFQCQKRKPRLKRKNSINTKISTDK